MNTERLSQGEFIFEDYDRKAPFSSFLPGLTGEDGIPMWAFYTNRGQAIGSLGINSKAEAIIEFNPACTEYENTALKGYRTFIRINGRTYEPFRGRSGAKREMAVRKNSLRICEISEETGLKLTVDYFVLPHEPIGALVRRVKLSNISGKSIYAEILDGAAKIIPRGISNGQFQEMSNLFKSWTEVRNAKNRAPIFAIRATTEDSAQVDEIKGAYFYTCVYNGAAAPFICDAEEIFGCDTSLDEPVCFDEKGLAGLAADREVVNKVPCAFTPISAELEAGAEITWTSFLGYTPSEEMLNKELESFRSERFPGRKLEEADELAEELTADVRTQTAFPAFDKYIEQCYLDNFLRGGYPVTVSDAVLYLYSRKHGDPERDYNFFTIDGEYYSQGNGNFRDVCQNRRNDVFFCPGLKDHNIRYFASLIQLDGYNPLEIRPATFSVKEGKKEEAMAVLRDACEGFVSESAIEGRFKPGKVFREIERCRAKLLENPGTLMNRLLPLCDEHMEAGALEGYWSDHWDYLLDLIESYADVYPDKMGELMSSGGYRFYDSDMQVAPRSGTYVYDGGTVCQYDSMIRVNRASEDGFVPGGTNWKKNADNSLVSVTLAAKLFSLALVKFSTLDSYGMGIEMEGGKPGWNDAMNGLPAMFASSMPETCELLRLLKFLCEAETGDIELPLEVAAFYEKIRSLLAKYPVPVSAEAEKEGNTGNDDFKYWDGTATAREQYRQSIYRPLCGKTVTIAARDLKEFLKAALARVNAGIAKAKEVMGGEIPTYFTYEALAHGKAGASEDGKREYASVGGFKVQLLPRFLEGPARYLAAGADDAADVHARVLSSGMYDPELKMFRTSESLEALSLKYGRIRAFTPGWLERESIFLHMEYKYLYALLKNGLYEEYYKALKTAFVPFMDPGTYGRRILENSSFIASSANPDPRVHGRGFVARLSGSTTEVISMWIRMFAGDRLFYIKDGELALTLAPGLDDGFFDTYGDASWTFMGQCRVVYHNPSKRATFGENASKVRSMKLLTTMGETLEADGDTITGETAEKLRAGSIVRIDAYME